MQEGQVWEALMFAAHYKLDNLCVLIDHNGLQIDGHDFQAMEGAFQVARQTKGKPCAIVLETTKGKGVSYMENQVGWHGLPCPVERVGVNDEFGHSGPAGALLEQFGLCAGTIAERATGLRLQHAEID